MKHIRFSNFLENSFYNQTNSNRYHMRFLFIKLYTQKWILTHSKYCNFDFFENGCCLQTTVKNWLTYNRCLFWKQIILQYILLMCHRYNSLRYNEIDRNSNKFLSINKRWILLMSFWNKFVLFPKNEKV